MGTGFAGKVKQIRLCRRSSEPLTTNILKIVESGPNAKELEMATTAVTLVLRFRLYLFNLQCINQ